MQQAKIAYDQGKSAQAQEYWNKAYFLDPSLKEAQYFAGEAALKAGGKDNTMNQFANAA